MRSSSLHLLHQSLLFAIALLMIVGLSALAGAADLPLAWGSGEPPVDGLAVQSASGVLQKLHSLALEADYTEDEADALAAALRVLIEDDVPPGTLLQVSKKLLPNLSESDLLSSLSELGQRIADGEAPGQVANEILNRGNARNGEAEGDDNGSNGNGKGLGKNKDMEEDENPTEPVEDDALNNEDRDSPSNSRGKPDTSSKDDDKEMDADEEDARGSNGNGKAKGKDK